MYEYIKGTVAEVARPTPLSRPAGWVITCTFRSKPSRRSNTLPKRSLFVHYVVREDAQLLYGFSTKVEREAVPAADQRVGRGRQHGPDDPFDLFAAGACRGSSRRGNAVLLKNVKGLGLKTAQKIIVDLSGKLMTLGIGEEGPRLRPPTAGVVEEALEALVMLGFARTAAKRPCGVSSANLRRPPSKKVVRMALKRLCERHFSCSTCQKDLMCYKIIFSNSLEQKQEQGGCSGHG